MAQTKNIYQRIIAIMSDLDYIEKGSAKVNGQYRFVSHDQVTAKVHPYLVKHGVAIIPTVDEMTQEGNRTTIKLLIKFINADSPEELFTVCSYGHGIDNADKGIGKAYSYAYKYALLKTFNLETGDDPDNDAKAEFKPETPDVTEKRFQSLVVNLDKDLHVDAKKYLEKYGSHYKKNMTQVLNDYADVAKFNADFKRWKDKEVAHAA